MTRKMLASMVAGRWTVEGRIASDAETDLGRRLTWPMIVKKMIDGTV